MLFMKLGDRHLDTKCSGMLPSSLTPYCRRRFITLIAVAGLVQAARSSTCSEFGTMAESSAYGG
jgi:hypothetical protein